MEKLKNFLYGTENRRLFMRFLEVFILAGIAALLNSVELQNALALAFGAGVAEAILKFARELLFRDNK